MGHPRLYPNFLDLSGALKLETPRAKELPTSITKSPRYVAREPKVDAVSATYQWHPVQVIAHQQAKDDTYLLGTHVNTLCMNVDREELKAAAAHLVRPAQDQWTAQGGLRAYLIEGSFVVCKGIVDGKLPSYATASNEAIRIARLPVLCRPRFPLKFAALLRTPCVYDAHVSYSSSLVQLTVTPDGWISGIARQALEGVIDLSAVRFCITGGISLIDDVRVCTCDFGNRRLVCLQGSCSTRYFSVHSDKPLSLLPESCRPPSQLSFIVAGSVPGNFHLTSIKPIYGCGEGGHLIWIDGVWDRDTIEVTGIMYEVSRDALQFSTLDAQWSEKSLEIFVNDFQKFLKRRFGSIELAWHAAFDKEGLGFVNFTDFRLGCKTVGYVGNATRLWAALDADRSGEISLDEIMGDQAQEAQALPPCAVPVAVGS